MSALNRASGSTPYQRLHLRTLLDRHELPTDRISVMHRPMFERALLPWHDGANLDGELCALSRDECSRLIDAVGACR